MYQLQQKYQCHPNSARWHSHAPSWVRCPASRLSQGHARSGPVRGARPRRLPSDERHDEGVPEPIVLPVRSQGGICGVVLSAGDGSKFDVGVWLALVDQMPTCQSIVKPT